MSENSSEILLYKTRQHWAKMISPFCIALIIFVIPITLCVYFLVKFSVFWTWLFFIALIGALGYYCFFFWWNSWISITNQWCIAILAEGFFSYSRLVWRIDDMKEIHTEKYDTWGIRYGTLDIILQVEKSLTIHFIPRIGEVQSLLSILSKYTREERDGLRSIRALHEYHMRRRKYVG